MKTKELTLEDVTLAMVKDAVFGCRSCLWYGTECQDYREFRPALYEGKPTCRSYIYND